MDQCLTLVFVFFGLDVERFQELQDCEPTMRLHAGLRAFYKKSVRLCQPHEMVVDVRVGVLRGGRGDVAERSNIIKLMPMHIKERIWVGTLAVECGRALHD